MLSHWPCKSVACHKIQKKNKCLHQVMQGLGGSSAWSLAAGAPWSTTEHHGTARPLLQLCATLAQCWAQVCQAKGVWSELSVETTNMRWTISLRDVKQAAEKRMTGPSWCSWWDNLLRPVGFHPSGSHVHSAFPGQGHPEPGPSPGWQLRHLAVLSLPVSHLCHEPGTAGCSC